MFNRIKKSLENRIQKIDEAMPIIEDMGDDELLSEVVAYREAAARALEMLNNTQPLYKK